MTATHQLLFAMPELTLTMLSTSGRRMPPMTKAGRPISRRLKMMSSA